MPHKFNLLIPFVLYIAGMIGIGFYFYSRTKNVTDYILGGRKLNSWLASLSAQASDMSGWLLLGLPGFAYVAGLEAVWIALGLAIGTYLNWKYVAARLRIATEQLGDAITIPEYLESRFQIQANLLRFVSAIFILIFFLIYTSSGFVAGAKLISSVFGFSYQMSLLIGVVIIISYTFLGGFLAVCWTDFFQGMIMLIAMVIVPILVVFKSGGISPTLESVRIVNPHFLNALTTSTGSTLSVISIISMMAWGLGYFGQPHILARFMAIKQPSEIGRARIIAMIWVVLCLTGAVLVGFTAHASLTLPLESAQAETVFIVLVSQLVKPVIAGFLLAAVLAAIMSTADSQLLVASSVIAEDLFRHVFNRNITQNVLVRISRWSVIGIAVIASCIALNPESSVLDLVAYAWAGFGATFGPIILLSLYWKRMTGYGAIGGMIAGGVTVLIWKQLSGGLFDLYEIVPGFVFAGVCIIVISYFTGGDRQDATLSYHENEKLRE